MAALKQLFQKFPATPLRLLFSHRHGQPFSRPSLLLKIHELLLQSGIPTAGFSSHSIRKEAMITAAERGISPHEIKLLGQWKSDAINTYINKVQESDHIQ